MFFISRTKNLIVCSIVTSAPSICCSGFCAKSARWRRKSFLNADCVWQRCVTKSRDRAGLMRVIARDIPHLLEFSRDLTEDASNDRLDPLIGRDGEIERLIQILCRRTKNNPVLIGEPGVGKTAIVEGLAQRIVSGEVPSFLENKRILSLDISLIVAGTKYRGQFEERLKQIMRELIDNPQYIVFIDELHTLVGAGSAEGSLDAANILKPAFSRGEIQCIGATTPGEFRKSIEKDRSLERRFQAVKVPPPTEDRSRRDSRRCPRTLREFSSGPLHGRRPGSCCAPVVALHS